MVATDLAEARGIVEVAMNRRSFWKWLPAFMAPAVLAQRSGTGPKPPDYPVVREVSVSEILEPYWKRGRAMNNQCPVCGLLAADPPKDERHVVFANNRGDVVSSSNPQIVRCLRCNAAFWQDPG